MSPSGVTHAAAPPPHAPPPSPVAMTTEQREQGPSQGARVCAGYLVEAAGVLCVMKNFETFKKKYHQADDNCENAASPVASPPFWGVVVLAIRPIGI